MTHSVKMFKDAGALHQRLYSIIQLWQNMIVDFWQYFAECMISGFPQCDLWSCEKYIPIYVHTEICVTLVFFAMNYLKSWIICT